MPNLPHSAKTILLNNIGIAALKLVALTLGSFALATIPSCFWI
jgi:hypothetical protein